MRRLAKRSLEFMIVQTGLAGAWRVLRPNRALILAYHNVVPSGELRRGDSSLHLPLDEFTHQLDLLGKHFRVIPLHDLLSSGGEAPGPVAAITFDDAYRGAITLGIPEVVKRGLPAMVFVSPGLLGGSGFWWDVVSSSEPGGMQKGLRENAIWNQAGKQHQILRLRGLSGSTTPGLPSLYRPASADEVREVSRQPGISLGSHTWSHVNLAAVEPTEALQEMTRSFNWLEHFSSFAKVLSYPYGSWNSELEPLARQAGYEFGLLINGGLSPSHINMEHRFSVPRLNVPRGLSSSGFVARISGAWPR
jgi:peptidoglycan/xylan/chitin deacetylase (PgdA/CDA1 family)